MTNRSTDLGARLSNYSETFRIAFRNFAIERNQRHDFWRTTIALQAQSSHSVTASLLMTQISRLRELPLQSQRLSHPGPIEPNKFPFLAFSAHLSISWRPI